MTENKSQKGAASELIACAWLLERGYQVFRNVCVTGIIDVVGIKDGKTFFFDVKTRSTRPLPGDPGGLSAAQIRSGVLPLFVIGSECYIEGAPTKIRETIACCECAKVFVARRLSQKYCSNKCAANATRAQKLQETVRANPLLKVHWP